MRSRVFYAGWARRCSLPPAPSPQRWLTRAARGAATALFALSTWAAGCGGGGISQSPGDALRAYADAIEEGRIEDAYRLLSDEAKRTMPFEAFRRAIKDNPRDAVEIARALARPSSDPMVTATVTLQNGDELLLVLEDGKWRVDAAAVDFYGQATPRQAIAGFLRALERKRYDVILRYVPDSEKEGIDPNDSEVAPGSAQGQPIRLTADKLKAEWEGPQKEQIQSIAQALRAALPTAEIEETGDTAAMPYGAGGTVTLVRERGAWKIKDL